MLFSKLRCEKVDIISNIIMDFVSIFLFALYSRVFAVKKSINLNSYQTPKTKQILHLL